MNERFPQNQSEVAKNTEPEVDIELDLVDPTTYIVGAPEEPVDQGVMVGENLVKPSTAGRYEHVDLPVGEAERPVDTDIYNRMVGGPSADPSLGTMVGENLIRPSTAGRYEHVDLPVGEEEHPVNYEMYNRMVGGQGNERPDISI